MVDDYEPWRRHICSTLEKQAGLQVVGDVSDGLEAVQKAQELQPDLILLDIGLPKLNGIEAARRIRKHDPRSKILFLSENRSWEIAEEALRTGAGGYVVKSHAAKELLPAVRAVLQGKQFLSSSFAGHDFTTDPTDQQPGGGPHHHKVVSLTSPQSVENDRHHQAGFYSDDRRLLDDLTQFIETALEAGNAAIVVATDSHRNSLLLRLQAQSLDIGAAIEQGRYIALDAAETLSILCSIAKLVDVENTCKFACS